jgi:hypothetical protein
MRPVRVVFGLACVVAALYVLIGCSREPDLKPRLILATERVGDDFWLAAPYVVVANIRSADLIGPRQPEYAGAPRTLQLVKFSADLENVIKGDIQPGAVVFYYFAKADQKDYYFLDPGKRYIISLRKEGTVLRSFADATQLRIRVLSGVHDQKQLPLDRDVKEVINYILLTPGANCDLAAFPADMHFAYDLPADVHQLLERLRSHPDQRVRDSACREEASRFWYLPKCLQSSLASPDERTRKSAAAMIAEDDTEYWLRKNPYFNFPNHWIAYMSQVFEILAGDERPAVRKEACAQLRVLNPGAAAKACK